MSAGSVGPAAETDLHEQFAATLARTVEQWKQRPFPKGYFPGTSGYRGGPVAAVEHVVVAPKHPLFERIADELGPGYTLERLVVMAKYRSLFSDEARRMARQRLASRGWVEPQGS